MIIHKAVFPKDELFRISWWHIPKVEGLVISISFIERYKYSISELCRSDKDFVVRIDSDEGYAGQISFKSSNKYEKDLFDKGQTLYKEEKEDCFLYLIRNDLIYHREQFYSIAAKELPLL